MAEPEKPSGIKRYRNRQAGRDGERGSPIRRMPTQTAGTDELIPQIEPVTEAWMSGTDEVDTTPHPPPV